MLFVTTVSSSILAAALLAVFACSIGRLTVRAQIRHAIWILVLVKLIAPPFVHLPIRHHQRASQVVTASTSIVADALRDHHSISELDSHDERVSQCAVETAGTETVTPLVEATSNVSFPRSPDGIDHFISMIEPSAQHISEADLEQVRNVLLNLWTNRPELQSVLHAFDETPHFVGSELSRGKLFVRVGLNRVKIRWSFERYLAIGRVRGFRNRTAARRRKRNGSEPAPKVLCFW